jgi:hypothetical protein
LDGDGVGPTTGLRDPAAASAERLGMPVQHIESTVAPKSDESVPHYDRARSGKVAEEIPAALFMAPTTPLQLASAVRRWRQARSPRADPDSVINAVGWRVLEFIERGDQAAAEMVIRRLARDASSMDQDLLLSGLAAGLKIRGYLRLAALASTLTYTSARDGWLRFGGPKALISDALELDSDLTWSTLGDEIAGLVARGGGRAVAVRLIGLLIPSGRIDEAFACWHQACDAIGSRLPRTGPADDIDVAYDPGSDDPSSMLSAVIVARMNHVFIHEKQFATAAAALLARYECQVFSAGLTFAAASQVPPWTLITLLRVLYGFEIAPYEATHAAAPTLRSIAAGELVSAQVLAQALLDRAGLTPAVAPLKAVPISPRISTERASELVQVIGKQRLNRVNRMWPEFGQHAVE